MRLMFQVMTQKLVAGRLSDPALVSQFKDSDQASEGYRLERDARLGKTADAVSLRLEVRFDERTAEYHTLVEAMTGEALAKSRRRRAAPGPCRLLCE